MLIKKLIFNNYKTFYGKQEIEFYIPPEAREEGKNIILLGGLNGTGKTTILKAILYVLFGKRGISDTEHKRLFSNVISNTFFDEGGRDCSVTLLIELEDRKEDWELIVKWSFDHNKRLISENRSINVKRHGARFSRQANVENIEAYNRFIDQIIPYHAAPFFIFDGEEIKEVILRQKSHEMRESIHKITGMEAYKQLLEDLIAMRSSIEQQLAKSLSTSKISHLHTQLNDLEERIIKLENTQRKIIKSEREYNSLIEEQKEIRNNKIKQNSKSREVIVKKEAQKSTELELAIKDFNKYFHEYAINIILSKKIADLKSRLKKERNIEQSKLIQKSTLTPYRNFIDKLLNEPINPPLTNVQIVQIKEIGEKIWIEENKINNTLHEDLTIIHDISNNDYNFLINIPIKDKHYIVDLINKIEKLNRELEDIETEIRNAPEYVDISKENASIDHLVKKLGELQLRKKVNIKRLNEAKENKSKILNQLTRMSEQNSSFDEVKNQLDIITKLVKVFEKLVTETTLLKAKYIRDEFSDMLQSLFRKQEEFGKIEFDINTYTIRLYNNKDQEISIHDRSAGEMQMISSSLIWALTKASDLSLPMVIDTPLGRLDSFHRNHLINYYYKELSEQVIILSTDTEITEDYIHIMKKHSYRQYMLDYDETKKYTIIRDGYFNFVKG